MKPAMRNTEASEHETTGLHVGKHPRLTTAAMILAVLGAGAPFVWWATAKADRQMRADLLQQARLVAQAMDVGQVKALTGTKADLDSPDYQRLKEQLMSVGSAQPSCKWLYLMGREADGTVFFYVDSESPNVVDPSPPGQVYEEAPVGYRRVFDAKTEAVDGPVTDRWGVWVTALVPLTDPPTGAVLAVLGMDVDARTWKWDVATRAALPVGLMLVLLIGLATAFASTRRVGASPKPVLRRVLPPLAAVSMLVMIGAGVLSWGEHRRQLAKTITDRVSRVSSDLRAALDHQAAGLAEAARSIAGNADVRRALRAGDADRLLAAWRPVFEALGREHRLTHFYFLDKNLVCLLRVHMPGYRDGDRSERFTAIEAERTGKISSGIELGTLGTFTLRVVQPIFEEGRLLGYVELGQEVKDVVRTLPVPSGAQMAVVIRKASLNEQAREAGLLTNDECRSCHSRETDWDRLPRSVVIYSSQGRLPDVFARWADGLAGAHVHDETDRDLALDGSAWRASSSPLIDASGKEVGDLLFMSDITADKAAFARLAALGGTSAAVLLALLLGFIYALLRRTDAGIRAQQGELRKNAQFFKAIYETSSDNIHVLDTSGRISSTNRKNMAATGYAEDEFIGKAIFDFFSPASQKVFQEQFPVLMEQGHNRSEVEFVCKDGSIRTMDCTASAVRNDSGAIICFIAFQRDITERKRAESVLLETNRRLAAATAKAEMANVAKGEFLANMSHEIRTPMNGVIGMTGLLLDTELSEEQRRYAEVVRNSGEALLALLNDILDFSKIEAGKLEMEMLDFDLRALLHDFSATGALCAHEKGIAFICAADRDVPAYLRGDPGRLRQVLTNLTGNAVKFTHQGEIAVRAGLVFETAEAALVRFSIKDTGIGIPAERREFLFQKFTQADASTTRRYGGTGLGLAISKQLVEMMGGEIGVESVDGHGSEFWFTARLAKQAERTTKESLPPADLRGTHILIVDDNAATRQVLMAQLQASGVRAEEAPDSTAALQELRRAGNAGDPFQAAVVDLQMRGMDGSELARAIKSDEMLRDTRLVLMTSLGQRGDARKMEEIGFAAYLTKPVRQDEIIGCLSAVLAGAAGEPPPPIVTRHAIRELRRGAVRILLAEDNLTHQQVAVGLLKRLGLRADAVANGAEAIEALESLPYDLVLMDVQMPVLDGLEATRQIRDPHSAVLNHEIPIIAMTANAMQSDRNECLDAGMNDYVSKPVSRPALAEALDKWLPKEAAITQEESDRRKAA